MNDRKVLSAVMLLVASVAVVGCGANEARVADVATEIETPSVLAAELQEREQALEERERAVARAETDLAQRLDEMYVRIATLEAPRQAEPASPPPTVEPPPEPIPAPEPPQLEAQLPVVEPEPAPRPEPQPAPEPQILLVDLPAATPLAVEFVDRLSSDASYVGEPVRTRVTRDVRRDGLVVVPAGTEVWGRVEQLELEKKIGGRNRVAIGFDLLALPSGEELPVRASFVAEGRKNGKKDAAVIGGSAAGGAVLGRVLGNKNKGRNTVLGAVLGAAIGTAVTQRDGTEPLVIEPATSAELVLDESIRVAVVLPPQGPALARR